VTERNGQIVAYEIEYTHNKGRPPKIWKEAYPGSQYECVTRENLMDIINKYAEYS